MSGLLLRMLHRDERGQITILTLLGAVSLFLVVGLIMNTGTRIAEKTKTQDAADAAAISQASWQAHTLNLISMNNTGMAQMFAVFMITEAFTETWMDATKRIVDRMAVCHDAIGKCDTECSIASALCGPLAGVCKGACMGECAGPWIEHESLMLAMQTYLGAIEATYGPMTHGLPTSFRMLRAYTEMNDYLVKEYVQRTQPILDELNEINAMDKVSFFAWDDPLNPLEAAGPREEPRELPVRYGSLIDLCEAAEHGVDDTLLFTDYRANFAHHGYEKGEGPYLRSKQFPSEVLSRGFGAAFENMGRDIARIGELTGEGDLLPGALEALPGPLNILANPFVYLVFPTAGIAPGPARPVANAPQAIRWPLVRFFPGAMLYDAWSQTPGDDFFTQRLERNWDAVCRVGGSVTLLFGDLSPFKIYVLQGSAETTPGLPELVRDNLAVMAFAGLEGHRPMAPGFYRHPTDGAYAYAQAQVFNPVSHDLYTSAWSARLVRSRFIDDGKKREAIEQALRRQGGFAAFADLLRRLRGVDDDDVRSVNLH